MSEVGKELVRICYGGVLPSLPFDLTLDVMTLLGSSKPRTRIKVVRYVAIECLKTLTGAFYASRMMSMSKS
jgi:hypothetical protein